MKQVISKLFSRVAAVAAVALLTAATAWGGTVELTQSALGLTGSYTTNTEKTIGGITFVYTDLMKKNETIQAKASTGVIYNKTAFPGDITSVAITHDGTARATTIMGSSDGSNWTQVATGSGSITGDFSGKGYKFFKITRGSNAAYWTKIAITYTESSPSEVATTTTINSSGITNTDVYLGTNAGSLSAIVKDNNNIVISGAAVQWSGNNDDVATINTSSGSVTLVSAGTVTFTATYAGVSGQYKPSFGSYVMTVTSSAPYVQPTEFDINLNNSLFGTGYDGSASGITDQSPISGAKDNVTIVYAGGGNHYVNDSQIRFYPSNKLTFEAPSGYDIKSIVFTPAGTWSATISTSSGEYSSSAKTWTGSASSVVFTGSGSGRCDMSKVTITIGKPTPTISADNVDISYNATSGNIEFTIGNVPSPAGTISASSESEWLTLGTVGETVPFTCAANTETTARTATVTLTYTYNTNETVTKQVTVTQAAAPVIYSTIPALFDVATATAADVNVTFNNWVVSGVSTNGKNVFVTDNAGNGFVIFDKDGKLDDIYSVGSIVSGTAVACKLVLYNGFAEITNLDASDLTISSGGEVAVASIDMADLAGVNTGALVSYEGLTCSVDASGSTPKYYLSDGTTTLQVYNTLFAFGALEAGKIYNITGIYQQFNATKEILPRSADDIAEVVITTPFITVTPSTADHLASDEVGTLDIIYDHLNVESVEDFDIAFFDAADGNPMSQPDWILVEVAEQDSNVGEGYVVSYVMEANTGEARSAYFMVYAKDNDDVAVYSNIVTINQAAYVSDTATLPFEYDGNGTGQLPAGFTVSGLGTYNSSPAMKFDGTGDYAILKFNEAPGKLTFDIKGNTFSGGTFTVQTSADGITYADLATYTELGATQSEEFGDLPETVRYIKWIYTEKVSGNVALGNIKLSRKASTPDTYELSLAAGDGGYWGTFYNGGAMYVLPEGAQAFTMNADKKLFRLGGSNDKGRYIPAGTAVVIISDVSAVTLTKGNYAEEITVNGGENILQGDDFPVEVDGNQYVLGKKNGVVGFYKFLGADIPENKAFYVISE